MGRFIFCFEAKRITMILGQKQTDSLGKVKKLGYGFCELTCTKCTTFWDRNFKLKSWLCWCIETFESVFLWTFEVSYEYLSLVNSDLPFSLFQQICVLKNLYCKYRLHRISRIPRVKNRLKPTNFVSIFFSSNWRRWKCFCFIFFYG